MQEPQRHTDIVLTYVDRDVPDFVDNCIAHTGSCPPCQYRTLGELRYALRSIAAYAPWARVILVVQDKRHVPSWVDSKIVRIVEHRNFIPSHLIPTFHFRTIFSHLYLIEGLRERFIVWSDDCIANSSLSEHDFYDARNIPELGMSAFSIPIRPPVRRRYAHMQYESAKLLRQISGRFRLYMIYPHVPIPLTKSLWLEHLKVLAPYPIYQDTIQMRGRMDESLVVSVATMGLFANWVQTQVRGQNDFVRSAALLREVAVQLIWKCWNRGAHRCPAFSKYAVVNNPATMQRNMKRLLRERALFANLNDEAYDSWGEVGSEAHINPDCLDQLHETLATLLPQSCKFEIRTTATPRVTARGQQSAC